MPTVMRIDGLRVVIYANDHRPPHVHVLGPGREAVFLLSAPTGPPTLRGNIGFSTSELNRVASIISANLAQLFSEWQRFHNDHR